MKLAEYIFGRMFEFNDLFRSKLVSLIKNEATLKFTLEKERFRHPFLLHARAEEFDSLSAIEKAEFAYDVRKLFPEDTDAAIMEKAKVYFVIAIINT